MGHHIVFKYIMWYSIPEGSNVKDIYYKNKYTMIYNVKIYTLIYKNR